MTQQDDPSKRHKKYSVEWYTPAPLLAAMIGALTSRPEWAEELVSGQWGDPCTGPAALAYQAAQGVPAPAWHLTGQALETAWEDLPLFVNPPFGKGMGRWVRRCKAHTRPVILLTPASTEVGWWQDAYSKAHGVLYLRGRVAFLDADLVPRKDNPKGTTLFLFSDDATPLAGQIVALRLMVWASEHGHIWEDLRRRR